MNEFIGNFFNGDQDITSVPIANISMLEDSFWCLKNVPMMDILELFNKEKAKTIFASIDKIIAFAHVSQSIGNYLVRDDSLYPILSTFC